MNLAKGKKYEITLLLNCFTGLLFLPQQYWFDYLPESIISRSEWGLKPEHISFIRHGEKKNIKNISRHLHNAISHYNFKAFENSRNEISSIKFTDYKNDDKTFEAMIPINCLKKFLNKFSDENEKIVSYTELLCHNEYM